LPWECEGSLPHTPSHFFTLLGVCDVIPGLRLGTHPCDLFALTLGLPFGPQHYNPFALVASPELGLRHNQFSTKEEATHPSMCLDYGRKKQGDGD